jgi:transcription elongation factor GreB
MSKAFTRESDNEEELPVLRPRPALPPGTKNYLTPGGAATLRKDLEELSSARQSALASAGDEVEKKAMLQKIDRRMRELEENLRGAEIVPVPERPWEEVRFGATVRVRDESGEETRYRIVGVGETNLDLDWVSWISPIGRALLNQRTGGKVKIQAPGGGRILEILEMTYE